jgi:hypothetical protein
MKMERKMKMKIMMKIEMKTKSGVVEHVADNSLLIVTGHRR